MEDVRISVEQTFDGPKDKPYKYMVIRDFWNGKRTVHYTNEYIPNTTVLGIVKENVYVDKRYEARRRLYDYIERKQNGTKQ